MTPSYNLFASFLPILLLLLPCEIVCTLGISLSHSLSRPVNVCVCVVHFLPFLRCTPCQFHVNSFFSRLIYSTTQNVHNRHSIECSNAFVFSLYFHLSERGRLKLPRHSFFSALPMSLLLFWFQDSIYLQYSMISQ